MKNYNKELIRRYRDNKATEEELEVFFLLMNEGRLEKELKEVMEEDSVEGEKKGQLVPMHQRSWFRVAAAAILIFIVGGTYLLVNKTDNKQPITSNEKPPVQDIAPGGNKAILTLADGSKIILDKAANGALTQQGSAKIIKLEDGQLAYNTLNEKPTEVLYNTITTPRGGQYQITLSDGSKVWLNAASSLRFPANFVGDERKVELTGEGYFEVAKNTSMPFMVNVAAKGEVEVLGTHFNVNSYSDESTINTTLLEGKVKVTGFTNNNSQVLSPGQQAQLNSIGQISLNNDPDVDEVMAWKSGLFNFNTLDIESIMRQISRWYDVDVSYEGKNGKETFSGIVNRNTNVSQVLKILEEGGVKFSIEGKKIIVKLGEMNN